MLPVTVSVNEFAPITSPEELLPEPPVIEPVTENVPVELNDTPTADDPVPPVMLPTTDALAVPDTEMQAVDVDPANTFAVSVTPLLRLNDPPAVAPPVVSLRTSPVDPRSVDTLSVTVNELATSTSPLTNVALAAVPPGVVAQMAALTLPLDRAK
jgi:hypothetical protein